MTYQEIKDYAIAKGYLKAEQRLDNNCIRDLNHAIEDNELGIITDLEEQEKFGYYIY